MKKFLVLFLILTLAATSKTYAVDFFGYNQKDASMGCQNTDTFLPNLVICGRNPASGACQQFTRPCSLGDLVDTGSRVIVWLITLALLITPLIISYYGAMLMYYRNMEGAGISLKTVKEKLGYTLLYFILMLGAWIIVRTVVDIFQVDTANINTFLLDESGQPIQSRTFNN